MHGSIRQPGVFTTMGWPGKVIKLLRNTDHGGYSQFHGHGATQDSDTGAASILHFLPLLPPS